MSEKKSGNLKGFYLVLGAVGAIAVGAIGWTVIQGALSSAAIAPIVEIVEGELGDQAALAQLAQLATGVEIGDPNAPITIMEFADYQCPACQQFATLVEPQMKLAYVETGIVRFVYHDFPLSGHPHSFLAARAARCALDQGEANYWPYHDQLFAHQSTWSVSQASPMNAFETYAATIGLDTDDFAGCLNSDRHADVVSANLRLGMELGVSGTPTLFASTGNGRAERVNNWSDFSGIQEVVERLTSQEAGN